MALTAAELRAILGVDTGDSLQRIGRVSSSLDGLAAKTEKTGGVLGRLGGSLKAVGLQAAGFASGMLALSGLQTGFGAVEGAVIGMNAELEKSTLQFETLMGDADKARKHVESLFEFAKLTPFETGPIIKASKYLETFGGSALNTKKTLTLLGDAAAATSAGFDEVAFWVGRMYSNLQSGRPVGEAMMRLTELAVVSPKARMEIEKLSTSGAKASDIWKVFEKDLSRFSGAMARQATTWEGLTSTLADTFNLTIAKAAEPLFKRFKALVSGLIDLFSSDAFQASVQGTITAIMGGLDLLASAMTAAWTAIEPVIGKISAAFSAIVAPISDALGDVLDLFGDLAGGTSASLGEVAAYTLDALLPLGGTIADVAEEWTLKLANWVLDAIGPLAANLSQFLQTILDWGLSTGIPLLADMGRQFAERASAWLVEDAIPRLGVLLPQLGSTIADFIVKNAPKLGQKLVEWSRSFVDWAIKAVPPLLAALADLAGKVLVWIVTEGVPKLIDGAIKLGAALVSGVMDSLTGSGGQGRGIIATLGDFVRNDLIPGLVENAPKIAKAGSDLAIALGKAFANGLVGLVEEAINALIRGINSFKIDFPGIDLGPAGKIGAFYWGGLGLKPIKLPRFDRGAFELPRDMLALLHRGEMVVPRAPADEFRAALRAGDRASPARITLNVTIGTLTGDSSAIDRLSAAIADRVRYAMT
jgi:phage-related protein